MSTFQLSVRPAASDMAIMVSMCSSLNAPTVGMNSIWVPGNAATSPDSATSSGASEKREGTGSPSPSRWSEFHEEEKPSAPAERASRSIAHMAEMAAGPGSGSVWRSPRTARRSAEWPAITPKFKAGLAASTASR